jgi:Neuraminidase-like domain/ABC toxin N-terminal region
MNLEPRVSPASIKAKQWEWMKRYRVWEANRKVFLYPENWLEPELRDDQSPFFKETMSELLQSDITEEKAAVALLNYLSKLEEVAKLEPCGIHYVENDPGAADDIAHVVARTTGANRKYFYRRREFGYWTPWEQIKLDIGDDPVIPVVWNGRLFLFWLRILKQSPLDTGAMPISSTASGAVSGLSLSDIKSDAKSSAQNNVKVTVQAILNWSEYYNGKWQPARTSDVDRPLGLGQFDSFGANAFDRSMLKLSVMFWTKGSIRIIVSNAIGAGGSSFFLHNAFSAPELREVKKDRHFTPKRTLETSTDSLKVTYDNASHSVLNNGISDRTVEPTHPIAGNPWDASFFYGDSRHVFYVTTAERMVTVPQWNDFGIVVTPPKMTPDIPPLVLQPVDVIPDLIGPVSKQPGFGAVDPSPIDRFVTEDAYIRQGIGTSGTVRFGDKEIGPSGSVMKSIRTR